MAAKVKNQNERLGLLFRSKLIDEDVLMACVPPPPPAPGVLARTGDGPLKLGCPAAGPSIGVVGVEQLAPSDLKN